MKRIWPSTTAIGAIISVLGAVITAIIFPVITGKSKFPVSTLLIYAGIVASIIIFSGLVSWIRARFRRRSLVERITGNVIPGEETTESSEEDLRLKEYRTKRDEAEKELSPYLPANPRGAKRLINHERLYGQIAEDRHIFGGKPELTYSHLAKWVLIIEHWPRLGAALTRDPDKIGALENCTDVQKLQEELNPIDTNLRATDELLDVLNEAIPLSPILSRLVRFQPSATSVQGSTPHAPEPVALAADPTEQSAALDAEASNIWPDDDGNTARPQPTTAPVMGPHGHSSARS
jgi:hypothetical protein